MRHTASCLANEVIEHQSGSFKVSHHAVHEGCDDSHVTRFAALHFVSFVAEGDDFAGELVDGHNRWFIDDHTSATHGYEGARGAHIDRSEEHTSELQSRLHLVCRLL